MEVVGDAAPKVSLEYSTDGNTWSPFQVGTTTVTLANIGDKMYIRATSEGNPGMGSQSTENYEYSYNRFVMEGKIAASGNVDTLLNQNGNATITSACYFGLFSGCSNLTHTPALPATTLANGCYSSMFYGCSSLTQAPTIKTYTPELYAFENMLNTGNYDTNEWSLTVCNWPDLTLSEAESMVLNKSIFGYDNPGASIRISITCKDGSGTAYYDSERQSWVFEY